MANILIIDDDNQFREMLRQMIERDGYEVIEASDGKEGIALYRKNPTDLIITDLIMPEKDGIETIQELKKDFPEIKIIAISGGGRLGPNDYLQLAKMLGAQRTLTKPEMKCVWVEAYERSLNMPIYGKEIMLIQPPINWRLEGSSAWVNMLTGEDVKVPVGWHNDA